MNPNMISLDDARSLLTKLLEERIPVIAFFVTSTGDKVALSGKVDSISQLSGLVVSVARPPTAATGYLAVPINNRACECSYGDVRLLPAEEREKFKDSFGESVLTIRFLDTEDTLGLFFTL
jgi:hypothetical protein